MGQVARPTINEMVKKAMSGAVKAADIGREAARQAGNMGEKTASARPERASREVLTEYEQVDKLASALEFVAAELKKEGAQLGGVPIAGSVPRSHRTKQSADEAYPQDVGQ